MTVICILFMAITFFTDFFAAPLSNFAGAVIIPFQSGVSRVGSWMSDRSEELKSLKDVLAENERLQKQVDALTIENNSLQQDKYELNNLRQLYNLIRNMRIIRRSVRVLWPKNPVTGSIPLSSIKEAMTELKWI